MIVGHLAQVLKDIAIFEEQQCEEKQCQERDENTRAERREKDLKASENNQEKFLLTQGLQEKRRTKNASEQEKGRRRCRVQKEEQKKIK